MAEIGKPLRTIEVIPIELPPALEPEPHEPERAPAQPVPEREPAKVAW